MSGAPTAMTVRILDKEFRVACTDEEREDLLDAARFLNDRMLEIRNAGKVIGTDRIAVMAALNIAHELLQCKAQMDGVDQTLHSRIKQIQHKIESALNQSKQIEL